jgi:hypothetical protein
VPDYHVHVKTTIDIATDIDIVRLRDGRLFKYVSASSRSAQHLLYSSGSKRHRSQTRASALPRSEKHSAVSSALPLERNTDDNTDAGRAADFSESRTYAGDTSSGCGDYNYEITPANRLASLLLSDKMAALVAAEGHTGAFCMRLWNDTSENVSVPTPLPLITQPCTLLVCRARLYSLTKVANKVLRSALTVRRQVCCFARLSCTCKRWKFVCFCMFGVRPARNLDSEAVTDAAEFSRMQPTRYVL